MTTITQNLTENEKAMINAIATSEYGDGEPGATIWSSSVCSTKSKAAVLGSLIKKGFADGESWGPVADRTCNLTETGISAYYEMHPEKKGGSE